MRSNFPRKYKHQKEDFNYFVTRETVPFNEASEPGENNIPYLFRLLKDLFDYDRLGHEFYSLWGLYYKLKYSLLRQFVSNRLDKVWDLMRGKRNHVLKEKVINAKNLKIKPNFCWKFDCKRERILLPKGSYLDVRYSFCEYHKKLGEIFSTRHITNEELGIPRLIQLLLPESDHSVSKTDHLGVTRTLCLKNLGKILTEPYEYPVAIFLKRYKISNPELYGETKSMIMEYWQCFPEEFPEDFSY